MVVFKQIINMLHLTDDLLYARVLLDRPLWSGASEVYRSMSLKGMQGKGTWFRGDPPPFRTHNPAN